MTEVTLQALSRYPGTNSMPDKHAAVMIGLERAALERWAQGDPSGFLDLTEHDATYFDPYLEKRLDGLPALRSLYESFRGKFRIDRWEMIDPKVQIIGEAAVLSYNFESHGSEGWKSWNTTEVYRRTPDGWRIIHTHWSLQTTPMAA
jgi:hypothetical protein